MAKLEVSINALTNKTQTSKYKSKCNRVELSMILLKTIGGYSTVVAPLPIPNREVKHSCANSTENRESR